MNTDVNSNKSVKKVSAVIVAAGTSSRMHGIDKQFLDIGGMPVIARTVFAFQKSDIISEIVIVTREEIIDKIKETVNRYGFDKVSAVVSGGETRQMSVFNGISVCSSDCDYIAVHDGARPFVTEKIISDTVNASFEYGAATAAVTAKDTVKIVDENNKIVKTVNRDTVRLIQTPQVFEKKSYINAMQTVPDSKSFTDDCVLMEKAGYEVVAVESSSLNIKITTREDIIFANAISEGAKND